MFRMNHTPRLLSIGLCVLSAATATGTAMASTSTDGEVRVEPGVVTVKAQTVTLVAGCAATGPDGTAEGGAPCLGGMISLRDKKGKTLSKRPVASSELKSGEHVKLKVTLTANAVKRVRRANCLTALGIAGGADEQSSAGLQTTLTLRFPGAKCK